MECAHMIPENTLPDPIFFLFFVAVGLNLYLIYVWKYKSTLDFYQCVPIVCIYDVGVLVLYYISVVT